MTKEITKEILLLLKNVFASPQLECLAYDFKDNKVEFHVRERGDYLDLNRDSEDRFDVSLDGLLQMAKEAEPLRKEFDAFMCYRHGASSLLLRAAGELPDTFAVSESLLLHNLTPISRHYERIPAARWEELLNLAAAMISRTYFEKETTVIKAFADSSDLLEHFLNRGFCRKAVYMLGDFESFFAQNARKPERLAENARFTKQFKNWRNLPGWLAEETNRPLTDEQYLALNWYFTRFYFVNNMAKYDSVAYLEVEDFLSKPEETLSRVGRFLGRSWTPADIEKVVKGPVFSRHVHSPDKTYTAADRKKELVKVIESQKDIYSSARAFLEKLEARFKLPARMSKNLL